MHKISIYLLGRFEVMFDGKSVIEGFGSSKKSILFLKYLLINAGKPLPSTELISTLWSDEKVSNPENALKTMVSRIRKSLSDIDPVLSKCIVTQKGTYRWEAPIPCEIDVIQLEKLYDEITTSEEFTEDIKDKCYYVMNLYKGDLATGAEEEEWLNNRSVYLHNMYLNVVHHLLAQLSFQEDYSAMIDVCRRALEIDAFDDMLHFTMMSSLHKVGRNNAALAQYRYVVDLYHKYLGMEPSNQILDFYKELIKVDLASKANLNAIAEELNKNAMTPGAFVCDYSIFKDIYQMQLRNLDRADTKIYIVLLTLTDALNHEADPMYLNSAMQALLEVTQNSLRKGDIISRYSSSQYAVLLPMKDIADGYLVIDRIKHQFYDEHDYYDIKLIYQISPIDM